MINYTEFHCLTQHPRYIEVLEWLKANGVSPEIHLNRMRFKIEDRTPLYTEFALRFAQVCPVVPPGEDYTTGQPKFNTYNGPRW